MSSERRSLVLNTSLVSALTLVSRIGGLIRDMVIASIFGTGKASDAFFVAFRIPNLLRRLFAEGALTVSFVPVFTESLNRSREEAKKVVSVTFTIILWALIGVVIIGMLGASGLVRLTAWGFIRDPEKFELTVFLTRVMFPYIFFVSLAAWAMGVLNSVKHFGASAAAPILLNVGIILGALVGARYVQPPVLGLALGALLGGIMQLLIHVPFLGKHGFIPRWDWDPQHPAVRKIVGMMIPAAYGAAVYQFNVIVITLMASFLKTGSNSYLWYADRVMQFPLGIFTLSLSTVLLPTLSRFAAKQDWENLKRTFSESMSLVFFITIPAAAGLILLADPIVRLLFQRGAFQEESVMATAQSLRYFALGLPFISGVRMTSNALYALQDSKAPMKGANAAVVVTIFSCLILMPFFQYRGLALSIALSSMVNLAMLIYYFRKRVGNLRWREGLISVMKTMIASSLMILALLFLPQSFSEKTQLLYSMLVGVFVFAASAVLLGQQEAFMVWNLIQKKLKSS